MWCVLHNRKYTHSPANGIHSVAIHCFTKATTISPFSLSLPYRTENRRFSTLSCTKTGSTQPKLSAACFVVQSCLADADFVVSSNYCLIGTRLTAARRFAGRLFAGHFYVVPFRPREIPREKFGSVLPKETVISAVGHCAYRARADINMTYTVRTASVDLGEKIC